MILPLRSLLYPPPKLCVAFICLGLIDSHKNRLSLTDDNDLAFGTGNGCVEKITLEHDVKALHHWDDDRFELASLAFMNGNRISKGDILHFLGVVPENIWLTVKADTAKLVIVLVFLISMLILYGTTYLSKFHV